MEIKKKSIMAFWAHDQTKTTFFFFLNEKNLNFDYRNLTNHGFLSK